MYQLICPSDFVIIVQGMGGNVLKLQLMFVVCLLLCLFSDGFGFVWFMCWVFCSFLLLSIINF